MNYDELPQYNRFKDPLYIQNIMGNLEGVMRQYTNEINDTTTIKDKRTIELRLYGFARTTLNFREEDIRAYMPTQEYKEVIATAIDVSDKLMSWETKRYGAPKHDTWKDHDRLEKMHVSLIDKQRVPKGFKSLLSCSRH